MNTQRTLPEELYTALGVNREQYYISSALFYNLNSQLAALVQLQAPAPARAQRLCLG